MLFSSQVIGISQECFYVPNQYEFRHSKAGSCVSVFGSLRSVGAVDLALY